MSSSPGSNSQMAVYPEYLSGSTLVWSRHVAPSYAAIRAAAARHLERHAVGLPAAECARALAQFELWVDAAAAGKIGWHYYCARARNG